MANICDTCDYQLDDVVQDSCVDCLDEEYNDLKDAMPDEQVTIEARIEYMSERQMERRGI